MDTDAIANATPNGAGTAHGKPPVVGLAGWEVEERRQRGEGETGAQSITKSVGAILRENIFTLFNALNLAIAIMLFAVGAYSNMLFFGIILLNVIIGIAQELKAKKLVDELAILNQPHAIVLRDGVETKIPASHIVKDDILVLDSGQQICNDAVVVSGTLEANESLLTGESDSVDKVAGDELFSGSSVVSGRCYARVTHVGDDNYANSLINEVRREKRVHSELLDSMNKVTRFTSWLIIPLGIALFLESTLLRHGGMYDSVVSSSAALLGMLPKGLVLLISVSLATGVIRLAKMRILVQNIYSLETLAHVDVLCLDKTGTLTDGNMTVESVVALSGADTLSGIAVLSAADSDNATNALNAAGTAGSDAGTDTDTGSRNTTGVAATAAAAGKGAAALDGDLLMISYLTASDDNNATISALRSHWLGDEAAADKPIGKSGDDDDEKGSAGISDVPADAVDGGAELRTQPSADIAGQGIMLPELPDDEAPQASAASPQVRNTSQPLQASGSIAFSSKRKWGAISFADAGTVFLGAPERILGELPQEAQNLMRQGLRIIAVGYLPGQWSDEEQLPSNLQPLYLIALSDNIRTRTKETLRYFRTEGVDVKVISGDHPDTVSAVAKQAGLERWNDAVDMSTVDADAPDEVFDDLCTQYAVFARVTPKQKRLLVQALQRAGHQVAMTGDGVNDLLALREADCSIAIASGSDAARQISQVVLLDSDFTYLPHVVLEGRKVVNNVTRTAAVFFIKTTYSVLVSLFCLALNMPFPFIPIQITLVDAFIEAWPSFLTIFESSTARIRGRFLPTALRSAAPFAVAVTGIIVVTSLIAPFGALQNQTTMFVLLIATSMVAVVRSCIPFTRLRAFVCVTMALGAPAALLVLPKLFQVVAITAPMWAYIAVAFAAAMVFLLVVSLVQRAMSSR
ncbi:cation-translocating P-type ATPase [Bifidobacterium subtile]|uniref:Cation-transporting ATPase CtpE n=1 Tax=Bifidobacterium subtile TaxID=77635 RepID=A0A087EBN6_9BIFI|nr:cation-translocating P-type ATPase [Bifidobacterium subtile]KFJ05187.1 cation-transporting ATPase CtpE [Bifidobacterium subtile]QOL36588.1 cation-translocating P-type ATPase [Bifidobacterium subtile]